MFWHRFRLKAIPRTWRWLKGPTLKILSTLVDTQEMRPDSSHTLTWSAVNYWRGFDSLGFSSSINYITLEFWMFRLQGTSSIGNHPLRLGHCDSWQENAWNESLWGEREREGFVCSLSKNHSQKLSVDNHDDLVMRGFVVSCDGRVAMDGCNGQVFFECFLWSKGLMGKFILICPWLMGYDTRLVQEG